MRRRILDQMEYYYKTKTVYDEKEILDRLPPKYRKELLLLIYKHQLVCCPLFVGLDDRIITKLSLMMRPYLAVLGDIVIEEGGAAPPQNMDYNPTRWP